MKVCIISLMPLKKGKRTFLKIKEKIVILPPKKLLGKKFLGIVLVVIGCLIFTFSLFYFWLVPDFFPIKDKVVKIKPKEPAFVPERVLIPSLNFDFRLGGNKIEEEAFSKLVNLKKGALILILSRDRYRIYSVASIETKNISSGIGAAINDRLLRLTLANQANPPKSFIIEGREEGQ